jgi:CubicO group peptidase (beta-lactamase class C family)
VIPAEWVAASLSPQVLDAGWAWGYGYQWWIGRLEVDGETWDLPMAVGNGNQRILIIEPLNMVMVTTAGHYNQSEGVLWGQQLLMRYVLPAAGKKTIRWISPEYLGSE